MAVTRSKSKRAPKGPPPLPGRGGAEAASMLSTLWARVAGIASLALHGLGLAAVVIAMILLASRKEITGPSPWVFVAAILFLGALCAVSVSLLMGRTWAQRVLLVYWLLAAAWQIISGLSALLWQVPQQWGAVGGIAGILILAATMVAFLLSTGIVVLLVLASAPASRLRYASMVTVTIVGFILVVAAVNLIAHRNPVHRDFEALGLYGVSEWTENVLAGVTEPVRLTCIYTSTDKQKLGTDYRPDVLELMDEMASRGRSLGLEVETDNVTSDSGKAEIINRLKGRLRQRASRHVEFLRRFDGRAASLCSLLQAAKDPWSKLPKDSFLRLWELPEHFEGLLNEQIRRLQEQSRKIDKQMKSGGVVDYVKLVEDLERELQGVQTDVKESVPRLKRRDTIAKEVSKNSKSAMEAIGKTRKALEAVKAALGEKAKVTDPKAALAAFSKAAEDARKQAYDTAMALQNVGGADNVDYLVDSGCWVVLVGDRRMTISGVFVLLSREIRNMGAGAQAVAQVMTPDAQKAQLEQLRAGVSQLMALLDGVEKAAQDAVKSLSAVDKETQALLDLATGDKLFRGVLDPLGKLLEEIKNLPKAQTEAAGEELTGENTVIVEVGEKFKVATFDEVWPMRDRPRGWDEDESPKRKFNGDSAIGAKILTMTHEPFATVYLTYLPPFDRQTAMQMVRMQMQMGMGTLPSMPDAFFCPGKLQALSRRLREANFEVKEWSLDENLEPPEKPSRPQVLVILPPSPADVDPFMRMMMQRSRPREFGDEHVARIRAAVNAGIPAIFLTGTARWRPRIGTPAFQEINDYLRKDWGVDVKAELRVLAGVPDRTRPGMYKIDILSFSYLPLSTFSDDHPIGKPLQGQRMLWTEVAPLEPVKSDGKVDLPKGVEYTPLLRVPPDRKDIWAPRKLIELFRKIEEEQAGLIRPRADDVRPPFDLAVVAKREGQKAKKAGATTITPDDVLDWKELRNKLAEGDESTTPSPQKAVWDLLAEPIRKIITDVKDGDELTGKQRADIIAELNALLGAAALYEPKEKEEPPPPGGPPPDQPKDNWEKVALPYEAQKLFARSRKSDKEPAKAEPLTQTEQRRLNRLVLEAAFPQIFANTQSVEPGKIVVLGMGASFFDFHLDQGVPKLGAGGGFSMDPAPKANADLVIAGVCWLSDNEQYIAAGPTMIKPVNVSQTRKNVLMILCVVGLPLAVAGVGWLVLALRRS